MLIAAHWRANSEIRDYGITTEVAALLTYLLVALAVLGQTILATAGTLMTAGLLGLKDYLHGAYQRLQEYELICGLHLALITLAILPLLPDRGFGLWGIFNPFKLWLMVVLICSISFVGHFTVRIAGARLGILVTGLLAGLASSTALTLSFARMGHKQEALQWLLAAVVIVDRTTMFHRVLLEVAIINRQVLTTLLLPMTLLTLVGTASGLISWHRKAGQEAGTERSTFTHPFDLATALKFAMALAVTLLAVEAARRYLGDSGVYSVAVLSGLTDVDAIALSLSSMAHDQLDESVAARGILIAVLSNTVIKAAIVAVVCVGRMGRAVTGSLVTLIAVGLVLLPLI